MILDKGECWETGITAYGIKLLYEESNAYIAASAPLHNVLDEPIARCHEKIFSTNLTYPSP
jgi:hypothetical protein